MTGGLGSLDSVSFDSLSEHLRTLHDRLLDVAPGIQRVGCALYDEGSDELRTFINSTRGGEPLKAYDYRLAQSWSLSELARTRDFRVLTDLPRDIDTGTEHSNWVLGMGYTSSFTLPMFYQDRFIGFIFFDSTESDTFTPEVQRELVLFGHVITLAIANELVTIRSILGTIQIAREFAELRDLETGAHLERMSRYARIIAKALVPSHDLSDEFVEHVFLYAPLHDIGKIGVPDAILLKPGRLTPEEFEVMKGHTTKGREMVDAITADLGLAPDSGNAIMRNIVEYHHEALDGSGYPHGLKGDAIPLESRIATVADIFDALTSPRPYKEAWSEDRAMEELRTMSGAGRLDPAAVTALADNLADAVEVRDRFVELGMAQGPPAH
jgi:HD-GYP domain-containing protein (c-di-GMP phosphodiesterase class II)